MNKELEKSLIELVKIAPEMGHIKTMDDIGREFNKIRLVEPLDWSMCKNWRSMSGRKHIIDG